MVNYHSIYNDAALQFLECFLLGSAIRFLPQVIMSRVLPTQDSVEFQ
jgi:hypothetical protein